jgi:glutamate racemase
LVISFGETAYEHRAISIVKVDLLAGTANNGAGRARDRLPRIAVFDSGLGGLTVHSEIARLVPEAELIYVGDTAVFPYGRLPETDLVARVSAVIGEVVRLYDPDIVVIACNTASTLALPVLRAQFPIPFVGTVPAVKPAAAESKSRMISVLATPGTVAREYTRELVAEHARDCRVTLAGSVRLAGFAEAELNGSPASDADILEELRPAFVEEGGLRTDAVVLACTHYPLIADRLARLAPWSVKWIDSTPAIARRVAVLAGEIPDNAPSGKACALFTAKSAVSEPLREALAARGISEIGILAVPSV